MRKSVAILQSNYVPWKGYFDLIGSVDEFILYDTAQFTKNDWRNRNKIKTPRGVSWLTIPVRHDFGQSVEETTVSDPIWAMRHWDQLKQNYSGAAHFKEYAPLFRTLYVELAEIRHLSAINRRFLREVNQILGLKTVLTRSSDYRLVDGQTERLVDLCRQASATEYVSGPAAKAYLQEDLFEKAGVEIRYMDYSGYPEYRQLNPPFVHEVSILDLIFNEGQDATRYMKSVPRQHRAQAPS
jgi:WbqC-like protein